jgi:hypothetical protein
MQPETIKCRVSAERYNIAADLIDINDSPAQKKGGEGRERDEGKTTAFLPHSPVIRQTTPNQASPLVQ